MKMEQALPPRWRTPRGGRRVLHAFGLGCAQLLDLIVLDLNTGVGRVKQLRRLGGCVRGASHKAEPLDLTFCLVMIQMRNGKAKLELLDLLVVGPEVIFPFLTALAYGCLGGLVSLVGDPELIGQLLGLFDLTQAGQVFVLQVLEFPLFRPDFAGNLVSLFPSWLGIEPPLLLGLDGGCEVGEG